MVNLLSIFWLLCSIAVAGTHFFLSLSTGTGEKNLSKLSAYVGTLFHFGKHKTRYHAIDTLLSYLSAFPKSWFSHFYIIGALVHAGVCILFVGQLLGRSQPYALTELIQWIHWGKDVTDYDGTQVNAWPVLIVLTLEFCQIMRRIYECLFISVFSKGTMSIVHYFIGLFFYSSFSLGLLASLQGKTFILPTISASEMICYLLGSSLFVWSYYYQHRSMLTFAALRNNQKDKRLAGHYIPHGHLFKLVSSPHFLCEILIYSAFCLIFQFKNLHLLSVALFVWSNQISIGLSVHRWYKEAFQNYPSERKAIIPYIL